MFPDTMFRLHRLRLEDYRSIKTYNLSLGSLTLLAGPNGSGRSNTLDALRFTSQVLDENLDNVLRERDGIAEMRRRSTGHPTHPTIAMTFVMGARRQAGEYEFEVEAVKGSEYRIPRETYRIRSGELGSKDRFFKARAGQLMNSSEERLPRIFPDRLLLVTFSRREPLRQFFNRLVSMGVFSPTSEAMRIVQKPDPGDLLRRDASNITSVIERLKRTGLPVRVKIEEYLSHTVSGVRAIQCAGVANWETLKFRQEVQGVANPWSFQASSMSDGTLQALGVLVALFAGTEEAMGPVGIEEPGFVLHPVASGLFFDAIRGTNQRRQILVASHSPDLPDSSSITVDELLAVCLVSGATVMNRPDAAAQVALKESLSTAGEFVRADQLQPEISSITWRELFPWWRAAARWRPFRC